MKRIADYDVHPAAELFPMLPPAELKELAADIKDHGLLHGIVLFGGQLLDGRNRLVACGMAEVQPQFEHYRGTLSPTEYVLATNLKRRQLTASQRATIAAEAMPLLEAEAEEQRRKKISASRSGETVAKLPPSEKSRERAASIANVSPRYVQDAKRIKEEAPEVFAEVQSGAKTISQAKKEIAPKPTPERKARGNYDAWVSFRGICATISEELDRAARLTVDGDHVIPARDLAEKLSRKLTALIKNIGK